MLTGTIPAELSTMTNLERLWIYDNSLTGTIPVELSAMTTNSYISIQLHQNSLTGSIPIELSALSSMTQLCVRRHAAVPLDPTRAAHPCPSLRVVPGLTPASFRVVVSQVGLRQFADWHSAALFMRFGAFDLQPPRQQRRQPVLVRLHLQRWELSMRPHAVDLHRITVAAPNAAADLAANGAAVVVADGFGGADPCAVARANFRVNCFVPRDQPTLKHANHSPEIHI